MQHSRYKDTHVDYEKLPSGWVLPFQIRFTANRGWMLSVFVNIGMRQYDLAAAQVAVNCLDEPEACGNRFRAAQQWGRSEKTGKRSLFSPSCSEL